MKKIIISLSILGASLVALAQKPQKVVSIVKEEHPMEWYQQQAELWKKEVKKKPANQDGWLYYYTAVRMNMILNGWDPILKSEAGKIVEEAQKKIPGTFVAFYLKGHHDGGDSPETFVNIDKAYQLDPDNPLTYDELSSYYEVEQNMAKRKEISNRWFKSNDVSPSILSYCYNTLSSLDKNAILFTVGDNDTYPMWIIQDVFNHHTDVTIINTHLFRIKKYREKILDKLGISLDKATLISFDETANAKFGEEAKMKQWEELLYSTILKNPGNHSVYISLTAGNPNALKKFEPNLYMIGLACLYSEKKVDNLALMKNNFENKYQIDYLTNRFYTDPMPHIANLFNAGYVAPLLMLYKHYKTAGEIVKADKIKTLICKLAKENNMDEEVKAVLEKE